MSFYNIRNVLMALTVGLSLGCTQEDKNDSGDTAESAGPEDPSKASAGIGGRPAGTTGTEASVTLQLVAKTGAALALADAAKTLDLGGGIAIEVAKINIGRIKLKGSKEATDGEKQLQQDLDAKEQEGDAESGQEGAQGESEEGQAGEQGAAENQLNVIKSKFDDLVAKASSEEERQQLEQQENDEQGEIEKTLAALGAADEQAAESLENERDESMKWKDSYVYDIVSDTVTPEIPAVTVLDGAYQRIEFQIKPSRDVDGDRDLLNRSCFVSGTATVGEVKIPFTFEMRNEVQFRLTGTGALNVNPGVDNPLLIAFDVISWFAGVDFAAASLNPRGVAEIDAVQNATINAAILKNIHHSTAFGEDENGDGDFGDGEFEGGGDNQDGEAGQADDSNADQAPNGGEGATDTVTTSGDLDNQKG